MPHSCKRFQPHVQLIVVLLGELLPRLQRSKKRPANMTQLGLTCSQTYPENVADMLAAVQLLEPMSPKLKYDDKKVIDGLLPSDINIFCASFSVAYLRFPPVFLSR